MNRTLTDTQVMEIRRRHADGETQTALAVVYGVTQANVSEVVRGKTWAHLPLVEPVAPDLVDLPAGLREALVCTWGETLAERLHRRLAWREDGCLVWTGTLDHYGYGCITVDRSPKKVHRLVGTALHGPASAFDHTCHTPSNCEGGRQCAHRRCVLHLVPTTHAANNHPDRSLSAQRTRERALAKKETR